MSNTNTVIAELQAGEALSIVKHKIPVGKYSCVGESGNFKGRENMSAFSIFKSFSAIESIEFFTMAENREKLTNLVNTSYTDHYSESEVKRFRNAVKTLIKKDCIKLVSKRDRIYMINPRLILGSFEATEELIRKYESL